MHRGWFKCWRKIVDSQAFQNSDLLKVWIWCLARANHTPGWETVTTGRGTTEVYLKPGQFIFGRKSAAKQLRMKPGSVYDRIRKLERMENIRTQPNTHFTIITICNWKTYATAGNDVQQETQQATNTQPATNPQPTNTEKNVKNEENEKKTKRARFAPPTVEEVAAYCLERKNGIDPQAFIDYYSSQSWKKSNGQKLTDWKAAVRTWEAKRKSQAGPGHPVRPRSPARDIGWHPRETQRDLPLGGDDGAEPTD
jgi:hypothetical protein